MQLGNQCGRGGHQRGTARTVQTSSDSGQQGRCCLRGSRHIHASQALLLDSGFLQIIADEWRLNQ